MLHIDLLRPWKCDGCANAPRAIPTAALWMTYPAVGRVRRTHTRHKANGQYHYTPKPGVWQRLCEPCIHSRLKSSHAKYELDVGASAVVIMET